MKSRNVRTLAALMVAFVIFTSASFHIPEHVRAEPYEMILPEIVLESVPIATPTPTEKPIETEEPIETEPIVEETKPVEAPIPTIKPIETPEPIVVPTETPKPIETPEVTVPPVETPVIESPEVTTAPIETPTEEPSNGAVHLEEWEIILLARLTEAEAGGEPEYGQRLVIDTVLNRMDHWAFPDTVYDVIYQPYHFSPVWSGGINCYTGRADLIQLVREEIVNRTNYDVVFFQAGGYSIYGIPLFQVGGHYFSCYDE